MLPWKAYWAGAGFPMLQQHLGSAIYAPPTFAGLAWLLPKDAPSKPSTSLFSWPFSSSS